jgi:hypothetical protein
MGIEIKIGKTTYTVQRRAVGEGLREHGARAIYILTGPRGAVFLVTDYGSKYRPVSIGLGGGRSWTPSPRPMRDLTSEHLDDLLARTVEPTAEAEAAADR